MNILFLEIYPSKRLHLKNQEGMEVRVWDSNFLPSYFAEAIKTISCLYEPLHLFIKRTLLKNEIPPHFRAIYFFFGSIYSRQGTEKKNPFILLLWTVVGGAKPGNSSVMFG